MPALFGSTNYGGGSRTTTTNVGPVPTTVPSGANMEGIYDLFRRMTQAQGRPARQESAWGANPGLGVSRSVDRTPRSGSLTRPQPTEAYDPLAGLRREAQAQQIQQSMAPMPLRMVSGPQMISGYMPDVNAMSYFQRQMFLPQGSSIDGDINIDPLRRQFEEQRVEQAKQATKRGDLSLVQQQRDPSSWR